MSLESTFGRLPWSRRPESPNIAVPTRTERAALALAHPETRMNAVGAVELGVRHGWKVADSVVSRGGGIAFEYMNEDGNLVMIPGITMKLAFSDGRIIVPTISPRTITSLPELVDAYSSFGQLLEGPTDTVPVYRITCAGGVVAQPERYDLPKVGLLPGMPQANIMGAQQRAAQV